MVRQREALLTLLAGLSACALDDRRLHLGDDSPASGGLTANGGGSSGAPAGQGGSDGLVDGCADLDTDGVPDCSVTLVANPTFASDTAEWKTAGSTHFAWDNLNALTDSASGSGKLSTTLARGSATQCIEQSGAFLYIAYANSYVELADDDSHPAQAGLEVSFFDSADCTGQRTGYFESPPTAEMGTWLTIQAGSPSKASTNSVQVALVGFRAPGADELIAYFDNILLKARELEQ